MKSAILNKLALALVLLLALDACKAKKQLVNRAAVPVAPAVNALHEKLEAIKAHQLGFNTFAGKAKTRLDINGNSNDVTLNIRIQRDQKIWVSVTATFLNVEAARALITPDSIIVINRLQSVYMKKPFSYVYQYAPKQVNYKTVESLLTGNAMPELLNEQAVMTDEGTNTKLSGNIGELIYKLIVGPDLKVSQTGLNSQQGAQSLLVTNGDFIQSAGRVVPSQIDIASVAGNKKVNISLHYSNVDLDQALDYPFSIPGRYTQVN